MKRFLSFLLLLAATFCGHAQSVFFTSSPTFSEKDLKTFYASVTLQDNLLLFNAPDYKLYAYDKTSGQLKWSYNLRWKSDIPPFFVRSGIWANTGDNVIQLDTASGTLTKTLPFGDLKTAPFVKNGTLYGTGIYGLGCLYAYNLEMDSVLWTRFVAHGCSARPYYLADKIVANGEGTYWLEVDYSGTLKEPSCDTDAEVLPSALPCIKQFAALTHDGKPITGKLSDNLTNKGYDSPEFYYTPNKTLVLNKGVFSVIGNNVKLRSKKELWTLLHEEEEIYTQGEPKILNGDDTLAWILYGDHLIVYNHQKQKLVKAIDLKAWEPHQALLDGNQLWVVSRKDGLLYGLTLP